jgi:hypothetical protein
MRYGPFSGDQNADLPVQFRGEAGKIFSEFLGNKIFMDAPAINSLQRVYLAAFKARKFSVNYCYRNLLKTICTFILPHDTPANDVHVFKMISFFKACHFRK